MKTWAIEFGRQPGETDAEWAAACKQMAAAMKKAEAERNGDAPNTGLEDADE